MLPQRIFIFAALGLTTQPLQIRANSAETTIKVYEAGPGWSLGGKALTKGQQLPATAELSGGEADTSDVILSCGKDGLVAYTCSRQPCRISVCSFKQSGVKVSWFDSHHFVPPAPGDAGDSFLKRAPKPLAILGARAGGSLSDAVVSTEESKVHWGPVFRRVIEGTYCLNLAALPAKGTAERNVPINWDRTVDSEGIVYVQDLAPGIYSVKKGTPDANGQCVLDSDLPAVWVLIAAAVNFKQAQGEWEAASIRFKELEKAGASPFVIDTFRHAMLSRLADSLEIGTSY